MLSLADPFICTMLLSANSRTSDFIIPFGMSDRYLASSQIQSRMWCPIGNAVTQCMPFYSNRIFHVFLETLSLTVRLTIMRNVIIVVLETLCLTVRLTIMLLC